MVRIIKVANISREMQVTKIVNIRWYEYTNNVKNNHPPFNVQELDDEAFMTSFLITRLCYFGLLFRYLDIIHPEVISMASFMTPGKVVALAPQTLALAYNSLRKICKKTNRLTNASQAPLPHRFHPSKRPRPPTTSPSASPSPPLPHPYAPAARTTALSCRNRPFNRCRHHQLPSRTI